MDFCSAKLLVCVSRFIAAGVTFSVVPAMFSRREIMAKIGYARVSTSGQDVALQVDALKAAGCERVFKETASGAARDRPELMKALDYLRAGDVLMVWKLDRLARSLRQLLETVELLEQEKIGFQSLTEGMDTTSAGGKLLFQVCGALAEFERGLIRERTLAGLEAARARGRRGGRKRGMGDEDIKAARLLLADPEMTAATVAKRCGVSVATLYRYIPKARAGIS